MQVQSALLQLRAWSAISRLSWAASKDVAQLDDLDVLGLQLLLEELEVGQALDGLTDQSHDRGLLDVLPHLLGLLLDHETQALALLGLLVDQLADLEACKCAQISRAVVLDDGLVRVRGGQSGRQVLDQRI